MATSARVAESTEMPTPQVSAAEMLGVHSPLASPAKVSLVTTGNQSARTHPSGRAMPVWQDDDAGPTVAHWPDEGAAPVLTRAC